jgi:hypothetical protein
MRSFYWAMEVMGTPLHVLPTRIKMISILPQLQKKFFSACSSPDNCLFSDVDLGGLICVVK